MNPITSAVLTILLATSALGQTERVVREPDRIVVRERSTVDFGAVAIQGTLDTPTSSYIPVRRPSVFKNLIKIRGNFGPELQKSVDSL